MAKSKLEGVLDLVPMFRGLSKRQLKHLASLCEVGDYMADHSIVRQGDPGDAFYVVLTGQAKVIATAFKRYGMIVADNGSDWYFQGSSDPRWDDEDLNQLKEIPGSAFEVVRSQADYHAW